MADLIDREAHEERMGGIAASLLDSDDFNDLVADFNLYLAKTFFSIDLAKDDTEELRQARLTYVGFKAFQNWLFHTKGRKEEIEMAREIKLATDEG